MANYTPTGNPPSQTRGIASLIRNEFALVQSAINTKGNTDAPSSYSALQTFLAGISVAGGGTYTGTHTFPTQAQGDNSTKVATTAYVDQSTNSAAASASTATTQAGIATTQAGIATTQAGNASTSATQAANFAALVNFNVVAKGNSGTATQTYDWNAGSYQTSTVTGNHTIAFSNLPSGRVSVLQIVLTNAGAFTLTFPTVNWIRPDGTVTTSFSTYLAANSARPTLQTSGIDTFIFWCADGSTVYGKLV